MGIYIKGMKMPTDCRECPMETYYNCGDTKCLAAEKLLAWDYEAIPFDGRADFCPLVEIPEPHGRLIDADALKETLDYYICEANWGDEVNKALRWVRDEFINSENTVIEAEGSENHDD